MFDYFIKRSKLYKDLDSKLKQTQHNDELNSKAMREHYHEQLEKRDTEISDLKDQIERYESAGAASITKGKSSLIFEIDNELNVTTKSRINTEIIDALLNTNYISSEMSEDMASVQLAFVLMANEVTEQIIEDVNKHAE